MRWTGPSPASVPRVRPPSVLAHLVLDAVQPAAEVLPVVDVGHALGQVHLELVRDDLGHVLLLQHQRHLVDLADVVDRDDVLRRNLAEEGACVCGGGGQPRRIMRKRGCDSKQHLAEETELFAIIIKQLRITAAANQVGGETGAAQLFDSMLRRFGLLLALNHWNQSHLDDKHIFSSDPILELAECLDKRHTLDIANGSTKLDNADIRFLPRVIGIQPVFDRAGRDTLDPVHDSICDMWNYLNRFPEEVTPAFLFNYCLIQFSSGDIIVLCERDIQESLIIS